MAEVFHLYAVALGSNRRHGRFGSPADVVRAAMVALRELGVAERASPVRSTPALGPAGRSFANAVVLLESCLPPAQLLTALKQIERRFGRRPGRRWGPRVLDLDIILWSGGVYRRRRLTVPHPHMARRAFVLLPLAEVAGGWPVPRASRHVRHLATIAARRRPATRSPREGARSPPR